MATTVPTATPNLTAIAAASTSDGAIRIAVKAAAGIGGVGILAPGLDEVGMGAVWTAMVGAIARKHDLELSAATAGKLVAAAVAGVSGYRLGSKILTWSLLVILHALPFVAIPAACGMNIALNVLFTYKLGKLCATRFADPDLTRAEIFAIARCIVMIPTLHELRDLRVMVS
jgi:hypothetical protein